MDQLIYHVLLEGRKVGPYDRRTIVGMRIKKTLTGDHVLIGTDGSQLTVADLIGKPQDFQPDRTSNLSAVQATYSAGLIQVEGKGSDIPSFKGELEARVQGEVLRIAGRYRKGLGWKEGRVKLALKDVAHTRVTGPQVDLWLGNAAAPTAPLQRLSLDLFTPESAGELVGWFPAATPWPGSADALQPLGGQSRKFLWMLASSAAATAVIFVVVLVAMSRRMY